MKKFNDTGHCIPAKHYMVDTSKKISKILDFIESGKYFTINRPRQFGKTTTLTKLKKQMSEGSEYLVFDISFEGIGDAIFEDETVFCPGFLRLLAKSIKNNNADLAAFILDYQSKVNSLEALSEFITVLIQKTTLKIVVQIDEVDKSSNNQLFISFLGMLRNKYLDAGKGEDYTFHSVILAGVHDVKTLKLKISPESSGKLNSPWNIAADFTIDMSFNSMEISTMLTDYSKDKNIEMDIPAVAEKIYYYTSGYPYLVSKMCKVIDEILLADKDDKNWILDYIEQSFRYLVSEKYQTTLTDDLIKNLENNPSLYEFIFNTAINGVEKRFNIDNPIINLGYVYGIIKENNDLCAIHNRIFEQRITNYMISKEDMQPSKNAYFSSDYVINKQLNISSILLKFQQFMKEHYSTRDEKFIEREGRLLFLSFLKPILNGKGYEFKEPVVGEERRMDIVVVYENIRYVIELKIWYGEQSHQKGLQQLSDYLDLYSLKQGFLLIYNFNKNKEYRHETIQFTDKEIFAVWV